MNEHKAGGGVPADLRARMVMRTHRLAMAATTDDTITRESYVDAMFEEIAAAGFEIVPTERMDRLREAGEAWDRETSGWNNLLPGDLEGPDERTIDGVKEIEG